MDEQTLASICQHYHLGDAVEKLEFIPGVWQHYVWRLQMQRDTFVIKQLNPDCYDAFKHKAVFENAEKVATKVAAVDLPALPALEVDQHFIFEYKRSYYLVFPWISGKILRENEITLQQARTIGTCLAQIHRLNMQSDFFQAKVWPSFSTDSWYKLFEQGNALNKKWVPEVEKHWEQLLHWNQLYQEATSLIENCFVLSHCDIRPDNVVWQRGYIPWLIDWESAGLIHPGIELLGLALNWSGVTSGYLNANSFIAILQGYYSVKKDLQPLIRLEHIYASLGTWLGWLQFNMIRSLRTNDEKSDLSLQEEIKSTLLALETIVRYVENILNYIPGGLPRLH